MNNMLCYTLRSNYIGDNMTSKISLALQNLKPSEDGRTIKGTKALIQAVQEATGHSQGKIADISKCSVAGIQRWINLDSGQKKRLNYLLQYARSLAEQSHGQDENTSQPALVVSSFSEAVRTLRLAEIEQEFRSSLQRLTGLALEVCEIGKLECRDGIVNFELRVK